MLSAKRLFKILIPIVALTSATIFVPWNALRAWISPLPDSVQEEVEKAADLGLDGVIVYIDKKGKAPEFYAAGWNNRENKIPADPHTLFKIASISKLYIAAASARLVNNKILTPDKTLIDYLPELAGRIENADQITLKMLLQHRSGIPDFIDSPDLPWSQLPTDTDEFLKLVLDKPADFKPGSEYRYSNTNYLLVGDILDKTLGYPHREYIKKEILEPLQLTHTYGLLGEADLKEVSSGYYKGYDGDLKTQNLVSPGGSMVATAQDVGIFLRALNDGSLLNKKEQAIYSSLYTYGHTGLLPGYSSMAHYHKDIDTAVVMLVNTSGGNSWATLEIVYNRIVKILRRQQNKLLS